MNYRDDVNYTVPLVTKYLISNEWYDVIKDCYTINLYISTGSTRSPDSILVTTIISPSFCSHDRYSCCFA